MINIDRRIIEGIKYLDFTTIKSIRFVNCLYELLNNPKNEKYKKSIDFLYNFIDFNPYSFTQKYRESNIFSKSNALKKQTISVFYDILDKLPKGSFKAKISSIILIEDMSNKTKKPDLAKIIVENFEFDFNKIFKQVFIEPNDIYFAIDLAYKFNFKKTLTKLKNVFSSYLSKNYKNIDFKFINLYENITKMDIIWNKNEHIATIKLLCKSSTYRKKRLFSQALSWQNQSEKNIICCTINLIVFLLEHIATNKYKCIKNKLYQEIIDINLRFAEQIKDYGMSLEALQSAKIIADIKNDKVLMKDINQRIQILNQKIIKKQKTIYAPFDEKQQELIEQYETMLNAMFDDKYNLFEIFIRVESFFKIGDIVDFDTFLKTGSVFRLLTTRIEFKENGLINNVRTDLYDIFEEYKFCIEWCGILYEMLKNKLLQKFYPSKEYFYPLVCNNGVIPKEYEEMVARMLYAGIHNDNMDFFVYSAVSIESILRTILMKNNYNVIKNNKNNKTIQENETLEAMIKEIKSKKYIDEKDIKELELLFCRKGFNIRNEIAHSNFTQKHFTKNHLLCSYLWGFMMKFFIKYRSYNPEFDTD